MNGPMLTMTEAAELAKVSPRTATRWAAAGIMPARRLGGTWRISPEALARFLGREESGPAPREECLS